MKSQPSSPSQKYDTVTPVEDQHKNSELTDAPAVEDGILRPSHYVGKTGMEAIQVIREFGLDQSFELGNAAKYLLRAGKKGSKIEDIKKARNVLDMWLENNKEES